jgi:hypothetical protein
MPCARQFLNIDELSRGVVPTGFLDDIGRCGCFAPAPTPVKGQQVSITLRKLLSLASLSQRKKIGVPARRKHARGYETVMQAANALCIRCGGFVSCGLHANGRQRFGSQIYVEKNGVRSRLVPAPALFARRLIHFLGELELFFLPPPTQPTRG